MAQRRRSRVLLLTVVIVVAVTAVALAIAQDQETLKLRSSVAADDPRGPEYLAVLLGAEVVRGNTYDVLTNGDQIFPAMLEAIDRAERRISFETYVYKDGKVADAFTSAFQNAARRGVEVCVVIDPIGSVGMSQAHVDRLRDAGVRLVTINAPRWYELEEVNYRTHRKILVVDGRVGFTGGVGVADYWLGNAQDKDHWRETHVRLRGPIVQSLEAAFYDNLAEAGGTVTPIVDERQAEGHSEDASVLLWSAPSGGSNELKKLYLLTIAMARRSIDVTSPYFITDESTMWALKDAVDRGVRIRVLMESDITDAKPVKYASRDAFERLLALGIELHEYLPTMMHAKVMVVDGVVSVFGSANFDNRSLELNDELNIVVASPTLASRFLADFEQDLRLSRRLDLEQWRQRPMFDKARERFWGYFGEVF